MVSMPVPSTRTNGNTSSSSSNARSSSTEGAMNGRLPEELVQDSFHSYLKSSLAQAKAERLLGDDLLSSAEADLMVTGPALCLYFAALRCTTNPPSVPLPKMKGANGTRQPTDLSYENCPPAFVSFLKVWAKNVPLIQGLAPEYQHDLARLICNLPPLHQPLKPIINGIAADLRGVAIEISQRRSFQDRYAAALQAALEAGGTINPKRASFVPPPSYTQSSPSTSPRPSLDGAPHLPSRPPPLQLNQNSANKNPYLSPPPTSRTSSTHSRTSSTSSLPRTPTSPTFLPFDSPAIEFIRETLYASLADQLERIPSLRLMLLTDPSRAYYGSVAFAILDVATRAISPEGEVVGVLGKRLTLDECPDPLKPFMQELIAIAREAKELEEKDNEAAIKYVAEGKEIPAGTAKMEKVKKMLEGGIGVERERADGRSSVEGRAVAFTNRINGLALGLMRLRAFRDRQDNVFKVLAGIGKS